MEQQFKKHGLKSYIGVTTGKKFGRRKRRDGNVVIVCVLFFVGKVFCGLIGSAQRAEYAVIGPAVNLSARLMVMSIRIEK